MSYPYLDNICYDKLNQCKLSDDYTLDGHSFYGKCVRVKDGDTIQVTFYLDPYYQGSPVQYTCRLTGIDTPEKRPKMNNPNREIEKMKALKATEYVKNLIENKIVYINCGKWDKYGRLLVTVWYNHYNEWINLNTELVRLGHAKLYDGGKKTSWN